MEQPFRPFGCLPPFQLLLEGKANHSLRPPRVNEVRGRPRPAVRGRRDPGASDSAQGQAEDRHLHELRMREVHELRLHETGQRLPVWQDIWSFWILLGGVHGLNYRSFRSSAVLRGRLGFVQHLKQEIDRWKFRHFKDCDSDCP